MTSTIFQRILVASQIEEAFTQTLQKWYPTYLAEIERQLGVRTHTLPPPQNYTNRNSFDDVVGEKIPKVVVLSAGIDSTPRTNGYRQYQATWRIGVGVATGAKDEETGNMMVKAYAAATRALLLQNQALNGLPGIVEIRWAAESYDDLQISAQHMLYKAASLYFLVDVENVVTARGGPDEPTLTDPGDYPEVLDVEVEVEHIPITSSSV